MADHSFHFGIQFATNPQAVLQNHFTQVVQPAFQVVHPGAGALQAIGGTDVEHQETVDRADQRGGIKIAGK
ncbi:hypothetical protein D3C81_2022580 [compost metagenome]